MSGPPIVVHEGAAPKLFIRLKKRDPSKPGGTLPYIITGATFEFNVKEDPDSPTEAFDYNSPTEIQIITDGTVLGAKYSEISIQTAAADHLVPGFYYYHLVVIVSGLPDIVAANTYEVVNI